LLATEVAMVAVTKTDAWLASTPKLNFASPPHGAGDLCAALFAAALFDGKGGDGNGAAALSYTASAIHVLLDETARLGKSEMALVEAQDLFAAPPQVYPALALF